MLLVNKGACAIAKDNVFCLEGEIRHAPKEKETRWPKEL